ncbi:MAG TPA: hypothetical protein VLL52_12925 [Anaerolineae bacterium]|nr:hypothetical protein [Anaerolineae bacterium]
MLTLKEWAQRRDFELRRRLYWLRWCLWCCFWYGEGVLADWEGEIKKLTTELTKRQQLSAFLC